MNVDFDNLAPLIRHAVRACQKDIYHHMSDRDYCETCPLLEPCAADEKRQREPQGIEPEARHAD